MNIIKFSQKTGVIIVDNKDEIKKKLGRSCDYADSMMLTMSVSDSADIPINAGHPPQKRYGHRVETAPETIINGFLYQ